jgi:hypothetical protein
MGDYKKRLQARFQAVDDRPHSELVPIVLSILSPFQQFQRVRAAALASLINTCLLNRVLTQFWHRTVPDAEGEEELSPRTTLLDPLVFPFRLSSALYVSSLAFIGNVPAGKCLCEVLPPMPGHFR